MKKMIICQTPFQIIVALFIREQYLNEDWVDLVITNTFNGYAIFAERIREKNLFNNVIIANMEEIILASDLRGNISKLVNITFLEKMMKKVGGQKIEQYCEMYCWNYDAFTASLRSYFALRGQPVKIFIFDEGYITYMPIDEMIPKRRFLKLIECRNKLFGKGDIVRENLDGMLLFEPDLLMYKPGCPIFPLDRSIGTSSLFRDKIDYIFRASEVVAKYDRKYIFFEEAMLANRPDIDDESIIREIIDVLGKENVIVKLHPRTKEDRFSRLGVKTLGSDGVPWEAIALVGDFSDKILLTISSGSITNCRMLFENKIESYMLFRIVDPKTAQFQSKYNEFWHKIEDSGKSGGLHVPQTREEFFDMLKITRV